MYPRTTCPATLELVRMKGEGTLLSVNKAYVQQTGTIFIDEKVYVATQVRVKPEKHSGCTHTEGVLRKSFNKRVFDIAPSFPV